MEVRLQIPNVQAFDLDFLMLMIPESEYLKSVPVTIGTIHIDEIINLITDEELKLANRKWQRGIISRKGSCEIVTIKRKQRCFGQGDWRCKINTKYTGFSHGHHYRFGNHHCQFAY